MIENKKQKKFSELLRKKEKEILTSVEASQRPLRENELDSSQVLDTVEVAEIVNRRRVEIKILESKLGVLEEIRGALLRINEKKFGKCVSCCEEISSHRLEAIPWALFCVDCASREERQIRSRVLGGSIDGAKSCQFGKFQRF